MRLIRFGLFGFAFWMIGFGIFIFVGSLSAPMAMPGLMPLAALMGVVLGPPTARAVGFSVVHASRPRLRRR